MVSGTYTVNQASLNSLIFVAGKSLVTRSKILNATSGYTPAVGDILVKNLADSGSDNVFDHDDMYTKGVATLVSAVGTLSNTTKIILDTLKVYTSTAYATSTMLTLGTQFSFNDAIPATIDISLSGTAAITLSAGFSFEFCEEGNQVVQGVIYDIDSTDTSNITLHYAVEGEVHYSALGTDGTANATTKATLISQLEDVGLIVRDY